MKYLLMAVAAGALLACNEGPRNDSMETAPHDDHSGQQRMHDSPEMSGEHDEMGRPVNDVHSPEAMIHQKLMNDSMIVPIDAHDQQGDRTQQDHGVPHDVSMGMQPVMPQGDSPHHSAGNVGTVEDTDPEDQSVQFDAPIAPAVGTSQQHNTGAGTPATDGEEQHQGARMDDHDRPLTHP